MDAGNQQGAAAGYEAQEQALADRLAQLEANYEGALKRIFVLERRLSHSALFSAKFLERAFTVWGHYIVVQLILAIPGFLLMLLFGLLGGN